MLKPGCADSVVGLELAEAFPLEIFGETHLLPLLVLTRRGRSTGKNQYW